MKTQEANFSSIPLIEKDDSKEDIVEHILRRIVCVQMGKATLVMDEKDSFLYHGDQVLLVNYVDEFFICGKEKYVKEV